MTIPPRFTLIINTFCVHVAILNSGNFDKPGHWFIFYKLKT